MKTKKYVSSMIRLTTDEAEVLKKSAEANQRSFAAEIRVAVAFYMANALKVKP